MNTGRPEMYQNDRPWRATRELNHIVGLWEKYTLTMLYGTMPGNKLISYQTRAPQTARWKATEVLDKHLRFRTTDKLRNTHKRTEEPPAKHCRQ